MPQVSVHAGVVGIQFDYGSAIDLEIGHHFETSTLAEANINFGTFTSVDESVITYNENQLEIPLQFDFPLNPANIRPLNFEYPSIPLQSKQIELP
ncbi:MAG: hypothetical protein RBG13Loki_0345 [Promethearchaeota archaeon CR_4]|nr:MAG: hypothetical protein RBG13Loki_0345 [Candidatus Lokiarchaeota archaeon CR_4]